MLVILDVGRTMWKGDSKIAQQMSKNR